MQSITWTLLIVLILLAGNTFVNLRKLVYKKRFGSKNKGYSAVDTNEDAH